MESGFDLKPLFEAGVDAERNTPAGKLNIRVVTILGTIVLARNISLFDDIAEAIKVWAKLPGPPIGAPSLGDTLEYIAIVVVVGLCCFIGLGRHRLREHRELRETLRIYLDAQRDIERIRQAPVKLPDSAPTLLAKSKKH